MLSAEPAQTSALEATNVETAFMRQLDLGLPRFNGFIVFCLHWSQMATYRLLSEIYTLMSSLSSHAQSGVEDHVSGKTHRDRLELCWGSRQITDADSFRNAQAAIQAPSGLHCGICICLVSSIWMSGLHEVHGPPWTLFIPSRPSDTSQVEAVQATPSRNGWGSESCWLK